MVPATYKMVDLDGLDLAEVNGSEVPGIYAKISGAYSTCRIAILCNWKFADIVIAPSHVLITVDENDNFIINDLIVVGRDDTIRVLGIVPEPEIDELNVSENGTYEPPEGIDGYAPVNVNVQPTLVQLTALNNGEYTPEQGVDGFSQVNVNVPIPPPDYPYITPDYMGLSYGYIAINGYFYSSTGNTVCIGYFPVTPGTYVAFAGNNVSNRLRIQFFSDKAYSDFEPYVTTPRQNSTIYLCTTNITGTTDLTGDGLLKRFFFNVSQPGEVLITTSNESVVNQAFLFKIS